MQSLRRAFARQATAFTMRRLAQAVTSAPDPDLPTFFGGNNSAGEASFFATNAIAPAGTRILLSPTSIARGPAELRKPQGYPPAGWSLEETLKAMQVVAVPALPDREHEYFTAPLLRLGDGNDKAVGEAKLHMGVFGVDLRRDILARVVKYQRNAVRRGFSSAKTRGEVSGSGKKPRPQKHTGRSRQGSIRGPHWRHGGRSHPPKPRDYSTSLPKAIRNLGLKVALSARYKENRLVVLENPKLETPSTKDLANKIESHGWGKALVVLGDDVDNNFLISARNLFQISPVSVLTVNVYDILSHPHLILSPRAIEQLHYRFLIPNFILSPIFSEGAEEKKQE